MSKLEQILTIEPATELKFIGPFKRVVTSELRLANKSDKRVAFKVKTTAPKRYCVRPNSGIIEPNSQSVVSVMLQPFEYDPAEKNNHKFMVQSMYAPAGNFELEQLWKDTQPSQLMDSKLKCVFEMSLDSTNDTFQNNLDKSSVSNDDNAKMTPVKVVPSFTASDKGLQNDSPKLLSNDHQKNVGIPDDDAKRVQSECSQLTAEIQRLKEDNKRLKDEGMRLRNVTSTQSSASSVGAHQQASAFQARQFAVEPVAGLANMPPIVYLVLMLLLGLVIGKFLL